MSFEENYKIRRSHLYGSVTGENGSGSYSGYSSRATSTGRDKETMVVKANPAKASSSEAKSSTASSSSGKTATTSSFLANIASSASSNSGSGKSSGTSHISYGSSGGVKSNLENRLRWMETAFKSDGTGGQSEYNVKATVGSARRRVMVMLREQMTPQMRAELEALDKELAELGDHL